MDGHGWSDIINVVKNVASNPMVKHISNEAWTKFIQPWIQKHIKNTTGYNVSVSKGSGIKPLGRGKAKRKKKTTCCRKKGGSIAPIGRGRGKGRKIK